MIREMISRVVRGEDLTRDEARVVMNEIMGGECTPAQIGAYLTALSIKGATVDEVTGSAMVMREKVTRVDAGAGTVIDTCGTGGDHFGTFNISTAVAFVLAGAGLKVAKHGNRAASSHSGSADVLIELGVNVDADVPVIERCIREAGIGFLYAVHHHSSMKHAIGPRREIGIRTIFNILGPLTNPAGAPHQLLGVFAPHLTGLMASVLANLGSRHACVVHGHDGMDEVTTCDETTVAELADGNVRTYRVKPEDFGIRRAKLDDLKVDTPAESARVIRDVFAGKEGPALDIVLLNAAFGLVAGDRAQSPAEGLQLARRVISDGKAAEALEKLVELSNASD
ncbi:MAG TPA: anthranilate phosphoribosyltransferase [Planctomycetota bacterium]|nr:anthranilate phosphoribosyltransferase [Planctomycetota bacterium]HUV39349.1 anthranilate phosphoribosyltransferase [Planctomycetota bacterium]